MKDLIERIMFALAVVGMIWIYILFIIDLWTGKI